MADREAAIGEQALQVGREGAAFVETRMMDFSVSTLDVYTLAGASWWMPQCSAAQSPVPYLPSPRLPCCRRSNTLSTMPHSIASCAPMKKSRSITLSISAKSFVPPSWGVRCRW